MYHPTYIHHPSLKWCPVQISLPDVRDIGRISAGHRWEFVPYVEDHGLGLTTIQDSRYIVVVVVVVVVVVLLTVIIIIINMFRVLHRRRQSHDLTYTTQQACTHQSQFNSYLRALQ
ncbi:hypothetical protein ElyMa_003839800 [Elysia marginata]|uniref:Uncharacterized protein n=1 Tax=Elysia marginata TaxID=1093978 RepID=A0AAV4FJ57_9GAST|nr:hypothetical protein ElyMa_003839800 [Elysia marginata]